MKKYIGILAAAFLIVCTFSAFAADKQKTEKPKTKTVYACAKGCCDTMSSKAGKCPDCKAPLKKTNVSEGYVCSHCDYASDKPGECKGCKMKLEKATYRYTCEKCKTTSAKTGKCPKCKKEMHMQVLKEAKKK